MALQIIRHALTMILQNIGQALRVSIGPLLIWFGTFALAISAMAAMPGAGPALAMIWLLLAFFSIIIFAWVAVSWHRFILLEEYTGLLPRFEMPSVGPYVQTTFILALIVIACMLPLIFVAAPLAPLLGGIGISLVSFIVGLVPLYLMFRFGMTLPAAAIGKPMTFRQSWEATRSASGTLWGVAAILVFLNILIELWSSIPLSPSVGNQLFQLVFAIALNWLTIMLSVCVLTTFYGHLIEKRPLID